MPLIDVTMVEGRSPEQVRALISALSQAAVESIGAPLSSIRVVVREVPATHWAAGDVTIAERPQRSRDTDSDSDSDSDIDTAAPGRGTT
jgi:4-oxalocrotonate tautomerase